MVKKSDYSKKYQRLSWALRIIDAIILVAPLIAFFIIALLNQDALVVQKIALVSSTAVAIILVLFNIIARKHMRSAIWIMIIGLYVCCENLMPLIIMIAIGSVLDEFVFTPLINRYHTKYLASRTIDERGL